MLKQVQHDVLFILKCRYIIFFYHSRNFVFNMGGYFFLPYYFVRLIGPLYYREVIPQLSIYLTWVIFTYRRYFLVKLVCHFAKLSIFGQQLHYSSN